MAASILVGLTGSAAAAPPTAVTRAAVPAGAINHVLVIDLENEGFATTFGPSSPATYLNGTLLKQGQLVQNYYGIGHASLDNYIAQVSGQAPTEETSADCLTSPVNDPTLNGSYTDVLPGTPDPDQTTYPGQVDGQGCIYPAAVPTIAGQLDAANPPDPTTHVAAWRQYAEDMGNQPTGREQGSPDPLGGLDCAHPAVNGVDNTNSAVPAGGGHPADQYATRHTGFAYFHAIIDNKAECNANFVPLGAAKVGTPSTVGGVTLPDTFHGHLANDLSVEATTPKFGFVTPNLCDDGHDSTCAGPNTEGQTGAGAGGLHGADLFLKHWMPLILGSPAYRSGSMLVAVTFDEANAGDGTSCCGETPGPNNPTPGFSTILAPVYKQFGIPIPAVQTGGGQTGAVLLNARYITPGSVNTSGSYNHYSALRSYEDVLGLTTGGVGGAGHLGFAASPTLAPFGTDVFNATMPNPVLPESPWPIALPAILSLGVVAVLVARRRAPARSPRER